MPALQVKNCPADVYENLRACANEENRSISQQVLTIIQRYLETRSSGRTTSTSISAPYASALEEPNYIEKRAKAFDHISRLRPLPVTPSSPSASDLLTQIREKEAR